MSFPYSKLHTDPVEGVARGPTAYSRWNDLGVPVIRAGPSSERGRAMRCRVLRRTGADRVAIRKLKPIFVNY